MSDTKLIPCPFCEPPTPLYIGVDGHEGCRMVMCEDCGCEGPRMPTEPEAFEAWNRRASPWQDIASAPKDGTPFAIRDRDVFGIARLSSSGVLVIGAWMFDPSHPPIGPLSPTHFMPLPQPPK